MSWAIKVLIQAYKQAMDELTKMYYECAHCSAGAHKVVFEDGHVEIEKQFFEFKPSKFQVIKSGHWIDFKVCPDCGFRTLIKA